MDPNAQKNYAHSRDSYPSHKQPSMSSDTKLPTGHGLPPSSYTTDKQNTSQSQNSLMTSKQDVSLGEGFLRNFTRDHHIYRSAFNDPTLNIPEISHNDTLNLDHSANPLVYKAKNDSSAWLTELNDATLLKAKESPDSTVRSIYKNNMYDPQAGYTGNSNYIPYGTPYYNQNSNPFGTSAPLSQLTEMKFDNSDTSSLSQPRTILSETTLESMRARVKSALLRLKGWEESRVENINNHRRICENIFETLCDRISASKLGLKRMIKFFTERIKHIRTYAKLSTTFPKLDKSFTNPNDDISAWVFPKLLKEFDDFQFKHIEKSKIMADFMENEILIHILGKEERRFKEKVEPLIKDYKRIKANLIKENERAAQATAEYVGLYKRALNSQKIDKDLFVVELGFMRQAYSQTMAQKELGQFTAEFIKELQNLEIARLQNLTQAMKAYVETMHLLYGFENNNLVLGTMSKLNIQQEIQKIYALNRLVKDEDMEILTHEAGAEIPESSLNLLIHYLNAIEFHSVKTNPLLLYETKASAEVNGQMFGTKSSNAGLTVDRHVVIYDVNPENLEYTVHKIVSFSSIVFKQTKTTSNTIEFFEVRKKIVGNNLRHVNITFPNGLEKKMFMEIYQKFNH